MKKALQNTEISNEPPVISFVDNTYANGVKIPWRAKMAIKVGLSMLPFSYDFWKNIGVFKHGDLASNFTNLQTGFQSHLSYYKTRYGAVPEYCLEIGPGDSIGHALSGHAQGIKGTWFVDVGDFATKDPEHYQNFYNYLCDSSQDTTSPIEIQDFSREAVLKGTGSHYGTTGINAFETIPNNHMDFSYSHAVLEHIRRDEFNEYMRQLYRVHKAGTSSRHYVDLHDHLGGALNSFRFSPQFWEGAIIRNAGFYTNRLTMIEMVKSAESAGFNTQIKLVNKWRILPTPLNAIHKHFKDKSKEELNVCTFLIILEK